MIFGRFENITQNICKFWELKIFIMTIILKDNTSEFDHRWKNWILDMPPEWNSGGGGDLVFVLCLWLYGKKTNLDCNFWIVRDTEFIFGMHTLSNDTKVNDPVTLTVTFMLKIANFGLCCHRGIHVSQTHPFKLKMLASIYMHKTGVNNA